MLGHQKSMMRYTFVKIAPYAAVILLTCAVPREARANTWNNYEEIEVPYTWQAGDSISEVLLDHGLGKQSGPLQIYGEHGWLTPNEVRNPELKDPEHLLAGTVIYLILPDTLRPQQADAKQPSQAPVSSKHKGVEPKAEPNEPAFDGRVESDEAAVASVQTLKAGAPSEFPSKVMLIGLGIGLAAVCGALVWARIWYGRKRLGRLMAGIRIKEVAEVYLRTFGKMAAGPSRGQSRGAASDRSQLVILAEELITADANKMYVLMQTAEEQGLIAEMLKVLEVMRAQDFQSTNVGQMPASGTAALNAFRFFVTNLATSRPALGHRLRELLPHLLIADASEEQQVSSPTKTPLPDTAVGRSRRS